MWIFLGILGFIALLITVLLLLPVDIIIKNDEDGEVIILYKYLFKTFGEDPDPENPIVVFLKKTSGIDNLQKGKVKKEAARAGYRRAILQIIEILSDLFKEIINVLKYCKAKKFEFQIRCCGEDAADAAINYGQYCGIAYPFLGMLYSSMKVKKKGQNVNICCDYECEKDQIAYNFVISIRLFRAIAALFRVSYKEARRELDKRQEGEQKPNPSKNPSKG